MKRISALCAAVLFALTLSIGASAETIQKNVTLPRAMDVGGKTLPAGDYKVKVDTTGTTAQVVFLKGKKEVANTSAQVKTLPNKPFNTQIQINTATSTPRLDGIDFGGTTTAVRFTGENASAGE
jgi:hypothetical protein